VFTVLLGTAAVFGALELLQPTTTGDKPAGDLDLAKAAIAVVAFVGLTLGALYAHRRQHLAAAEVSRAAAALRSDRYTAAATQLGDENAAARLAGVYAMARLADDWSDQRQVCIDVLCAYLRLPSAGVADEEVRRTLIRVIRDHLRDDRPGDWTGCNFSFEGATFGAGDLSKARFCGGQVTFHEATFTELFMFDDVQFSGAMVWFSGATFASGWVSFDTATFSGGKVTFQEAKKTGAKVTFDGATVAPDVVVNWGPLPPVA
jgi:hypothetical protein